MRLQQSPKVKRTEIELHGCVVKELNLSHVDFLKERLKKRNEKRLTSMEKIENTLNSAIRSKSNSKSPEIAKNRYD